jgi:hypothetical protein
VALKVIQIANGRFVALGPMRTPGQKKTIVATDLSVRSSANAAVGSKQVWRPVWIR